MRKFFFFTAVIGWVLSLSIHLIMILEDHGPPSGYWALHAGAMVVVIAGILYTKRDNVRSEQGSILSYYRGVVRGVPRWLLVVAVAGIVLGTASSVMTANPGPGSIAIRDGQYILHNHGELIRTLTKTEYDHYEALEVRGVSSGWLCGYGLAMILLFPYRRTGAAEVGALQ